MREINRLNHERGVIRPSDLQAYGLGPNHFRKMVRDGLLIRSGRGLYLPVDFEVTEYHSLVEAVRAQSKGVVCLLSALSFHGLGTQLPHEVWLAVPYGAWISKSDVTPMRRLSIRPPSYDTGIEIHKIEGVDVPIYSVAKTVADCFKFRSKIGLDVAIEALKAAITERRCTREEIRQFAATDRVEVIIRPYMEAISV